MKEIEVRKQVRLGLTRTMEICLSGIYYRLFRSLVTVAIVSVAVAFMMHMLAGSVIVKAVQLHARSEARQYKAYDRWLSWIEESMGRAALSRAVAQCEDDDPKIRSVGKWGSLSGGQIADLLEVSREAERYIRFFEGLSPGKRFVLVESAEQVVLMDWLLEDGAFSQFAARLSNMPSVRPPGGIEDLRLLLQRYERQIPLWDAVEKGRNAAIAALRARYPGQSAGDLFNAPPPDLVSTLAELGFADEDADFTEVFEKAVHEQSAGRLAALLRHSGFRREMSARADVDPTVMNMSVFGRLFLTESGRGFILESLERNGLDPGIGPAEMEETFRKYLRERRMLLIESEAAIQSEGVLGFDVQTLWLIGVSFVVCIVGIANAMLMSVMERFREIATMKCLGATDSFVMALFIFESCIQGVVGGAIGAILGLLLSVPAMVLKYGALAWSAFPVQEALAMVAVALGTGALLAAVASVYPASVAARLVPMEAMRLE